MVEVIITEKKGFKILGKKTWINEIEQFGKFWGENNQNGNVKLLQKYNFNPEISETKSYVLGLSCTEKDPNNREFWFYIGVETNEESEIEGFEYYNISNYKWAIFRSCGDNMVQTLMECEMYAWKNWLGENGKYIHDNGPELELYFSDNKIEYWLPIKEK
jgi:predicted transcriptional regulator YdeE